ncbi:MAG: hypothetical protein JNJ60_03415, partial [Rhodocyclaceae bacterium]|nr:hypothetical protein [Rhodocyclaceae bacterium]
MATKGKPTAASGPAEEPAVHLRSGPAKQRAKGPPELRITRHKNRAAWFRARVSWPLREAKVDHLRREINRTARTLAVPKKAIKWALAGPTNIGGRCSALVVHPTNPDLLWIGAAGGGVWKSSNAGQSWKWSWKSKTPLQIGALAIDSAKPSVLYAGTGEANLSADSYSGDGVYRSTNSGRSWKRWAGAAQGMPRRIGSIAVDPFDSGHVLVGGVGYGRVSADNDFGGLYTTRDGGVTWARETFVGSGNYWCHQVLFDAGTQGLIYATFTGPGARSGIWRSSDGGATWAQLKTGLPSPDRMGRTSLAVAASNPKIIYALCADASAGNNDGVLGVFRSTNGGNSWTNIAGNHFADEGQMSYGNAIAVHPANPDHVICGGVDLHVTTNAGASWRRATEWDAA